MSAMRSAIVFAGALLALGSAADAAPTLVRKLENGAQVAVISDRRLPIVQIQILVPAGTRHEEPLEAGAASVVALLLTRGTSSRTADQIAHDVESLGGTVLGEAARDYATVSGAFRSADLERGLELMADAVINPIFDDRELSVARQELARRVLESRTHLDVVAQEHVWALAMKGHPYAAPLGGSVEAASALTRSRVMGFHRAQYRPDHALIAVAGDVDPEAAFTAAQEAFRSWAGRARTVAPATAPEPRTLSSLQIRLVDVPGAEEAEVRLAVPVSARGARDAGALAVANDLLGGAAGSRLAGPGRVARAYSMLDQQREAGLLILASSARNDSVIASAASLRAELKRFAGSPPPAAEVERSRRILSRAYPLRNETLGAQAATWLTAASLGLGDDYGDRYPTELAAVSPESVQDVARRYFDPDHAVLVVVGSAEALKAGLQSLGAVEVVPVGQPATPIAVSPAMRMDEPDEASIREGRKRADAAVTAHGGIKRLKAIKDSRVESEITLYRGSESISGKQTEMRLEPGRLRTETAFMQLMTVQALHGDTAWTRMTAGENDSTFQEEADGVQAMRRAFSGDVPHLLIMAANPQSRVAFRGQDEIGGVMADIVEVVGQEGTRWVLYLDPKTRRLIGAEDNQGSPLAGSALRRLFGDLRTVQGVLWPHTEERQVNGERTLTLKVTRVQINTGISPAAFLSQAPTKTSPRRR
ncbi:MAG TPA: pitrilysin family protein [Candidatus Eisenbacteria bacterium]|nr:pitrilysin family protein [Candidatus Eisenbacteria bacterium]